MILTSFVLFLLAFVGIGSCAAYFSKRTTKDYLLAGQDVQPWLAGLSAVATCNSGYMFIAMIGYAYTTGLPVIWYMFGFLVGDFIASRIVHQKLRVTTEVEDAHTFGGILSGWNNTRYTKLRTIVGLVSLAFLGTYAAAQLKAGSKGLYVLFEWDLYVGAIIGSVIIVIYCFAGGIRASIWTDAAQSIVMIVAMAAMLIAGVSYSGGLSSVVIKLDAISPHYLSFFPPDLPFGPFFGPMLFILGWLFGGFAVIGQPHIMIRFMAVNDVSNIRRACNWYYSWYTAFFICSVSVGLLSRIILPDVAAFDSELALPLMASKLLPDIMVGLVLAGVFAATMSTADSLVLSCSAALTRDLFPKIRDNYLITKCATVFVTVLALFIALWGSDSVFVLVMFSWSAMGSAFGPLLVVYALGGKPSESRAIVMLAGGLATAIAWNLAGLAVGVFEVFPGICVGLLIYCIGSKTKTQSL